MYMSGFILFIPKIIKHIQELFCRMLSLMSPLPSLSHLLYQIMLRPVCLTKTKNCQWRINETLLQDSKFKSRIAQKCTRSLSIITQLRFPPSVYRRHINALFRAS